MPGHLRLFFAALISLLSLAILEKGLFALFHAPPGTGPDEILGALLAGLRFDLAIAAGLALLAFTAAHLLYRFLRLPFASTSRHSTFAAAVALIGVHGADLIYFEETHRHLGYELKEVFNSSSELAGAAFSTYLEPVALQLLIITGAWFWTSWLFRRLAPAPAQLDGWRRLIWPELQWGLALLIAVLMVRGGFQSVPLEPLHAQEIGDPGLAALSLNGPYNAVFSSVTPYSVDRVLSQAPNDADTARLQQMYSRVRPQAATAPNAYNVVILFLESWSAGYMSSYGYPQETTPHFSALKAKGLASEGMLAGGHRTTEGMFATLCSAQNPLGATVAQSQLQNYDYHCLPELLTEAGYSSAFFQGTLANTSGTGVFAQLLGFRASYGKHDMPPPTLEQNFWGRHDPDLYAFSLEKMRTLPQPFVVGINTNSTHDRHLPPGAAAPFRTGGHEEGYLNVLHFADEALAHFIDSYEADAEFGPTLFVLLADHTGLTPRSAFYSHFIPFALYAPGLVEPRTVGRLASQRDVAPTLLDVLNRPIPEWFTGKSLLRDDEGPYFADYYNGGNLGWVEGERLVSVSVRNPQRMRCYNYRRNPLMETSDCLQPEDTEQRLRALAFTRTFQELLFSGRLRDFAELRSPQNESKPNERKLQ